MMHFNMDAQAPYRGKRRHYTEQFKQQAVTQLLESGKPAAEMATLLGVERSNLQRWKKKFQQAVEPRSAELPGKAIGLNDIHSMRNEIISLKETVSNLKNIMKKAFVNIYQEKNQS
jgi:transposase-like protein